ncbi:MAG TPA: HAMP domain-containing sensor histidine kinase [Bacteroidales bacterium]|nr:HAMP domain-containing sensor histidine kinase [Bacteroidales bacterium]
MRKKNTILLLGSISMLILILVQVYIIFSVWKEKSEMFSLRYTLRSQEAIRDIRGRNYRNNNVAWNDDGFDMVRALLNDSTEKIIKQIPDIKSLEKNKEGILEYFSFVLEKEQVLSGLLSSYFESIGLDKNIEHRIVIDNLFIINHDTLIVKKDDLYWRNQGPSNLKKEIFVTYQILGGNHFFLSFYYYIDFSDKQKLILGETSATLGLSLLSIMLVGFMFMITYRNLMEERRLSDLKTDFINNMTHELKTPLSTITVAGKTLEMPQIRSNQEKILETAKLIGKQSVHLNQLINMILEISMWERTQFQLDKKKADVGELLRDIVESFKSGGGIHAKISEKYDLVNIESEIDVVYFTTLINNLLSNAVKYSDADPEIEVEGYIQENNIFIKISDNGIGISKNDQKHIFEKFYRASSGNIHKFKGLGLGLYYVKKIAEAHGGDVTVSSKPGKGSTFTIMMPIKS